jgi:hypothetical protein
MTAFVILIGVLLLLPGVCTLLMSAGGALGGIAFILAVGGVALIGSVVFSRRR